MDLTPPATPPALSLSRARIPESRRATGSAPVPGNARETRPMIPVPSVAAPPVPRPKPTAIPFPGPGVDIQAPRVAATPLVAIAAADSGRPQRQRAPTKRYDPTIGQHVEVPLPKPRSHTQRGPEVVSPPAAPIPVIPVVGPLSESMIEGSGSSDDDDEESESHEEVEVVPAKKKTTKKIPVKEARTKTAVSGKQVAIVSTRKLKKSTKSAVIPSSDSEDWSSSHSDTDIPAAPPRVRKGAKAKKPTAPPKAHAPKPNRKAKERDDVPIVPIKKRGKAAAPAAPRAPVAGPSKPRGHAK
ncbi:hypothetical protein EUX98_g8466 [Antrodiella citrinella]|uniref:Uncharacterized protein n=1 Tax=Antrodiella citrinella TaxID=2447956 RepID=A0A4S4MDE0_9APHY|nr:hypothetical protein EUX98_g8466 [Antrodiella citrinella]